MCGTVGQQSEQTLKTGSALVEYFEGEYTIISNWLVLIFLCMCVVIGYIVQWKWILGTCTSILWAFLHRKPVYFQLTRCDIVNDHIVHQPLLTAVFRIWEQNTFGCKDFMCPEEHAKCTVILFLKFIRNHLWKVGVTHATWFPGTRIFVDLVCCDVRIPLGLLSLLTFILI